MDDHRTPLDKSVEDMWAELRNDLINDVVDIPVERTIVNLGREDPSPSASAEGDENPVEEGAASKKLDIKHIFKCIKCKLPEPRYVVIPFGFFAGSLLFMELLVRITNGSTFLLGVGFFRSIFSCLALGAALYLITNAVSNKKVGRIIAAVVLFLVGAFAIAESCVKDFYGTYFLVSYMFGMGGQVAGNFLSEAIGVIVKHLWMFPLCLAPGVLTLLFPRLFVPKHGRRNPRCPQLWALSGAVVVLLQVINIFFCHLGAVEYYTYEFAANTSIPRYGLVNCLRLEIQYAIFGQPEMPLQVEDVTLTVDTGDEESQTDGEEAEEEEEEEVVEIIEYDDNVLDIDFESLIASDTDSTLLAMDQYFSSQTPTSQNEYTGLFEGKNLIMICAESFSYAVIDEKLTPTLYKLSNSGFVFNNFYTPNTTQSTTGGEFTFLTGILATWVDGGTSFKASASNSMPLGLGWVFSSLGYTSTAYHNNTYTYYYRDETHPNLGYTYIGIGNGLELESSSKWPASDLEMVQVTIDDQIEAYVNDGTLFYTYYMTVSGHCNYGWNKNKMSLKNQDAVADLEGSETVLAYIACQLELEYALEYLVNALEEAGIADDTVIVLTADHYPYAMAEGDTDYYVELTGIDDTEDYTTRYKNTLILWSGCMDEAVQVDAPCTSIDVVPTLMNLFGIEYDSRLYSGRDILAPDVEIGTVDSNMHVAIFANTGSGNSWITAAGTYEAYTKTFTPADGVELQDEQAYVDAVTSLVQNRYNYAKYVVSKDYYSHVFSDWKPGMTLLEALGLS